MSRQIGQHIYHVHIADGFSNDCDDIVHKCLQLETLDFKAFCRIWKEMNFDMLYQGRTSGAEIAELSEELIHIAKHYMVKDTSCYDESVAGLFLVYGLLNLQPFSGFASLRIVPDDVRPINRIETVARRERRLDILYILGEVLVKWTQYHAAERPRGIESVLRKYLEGYTSIDKLGVRPVGVFYRQNEELDLIRDLNTMTRQYTLAKNSIIGEGPPDPSFRYINENLANELNTSLKKIINGIIDDVDEDHDDEEDDVSAEEEKVSLARSSAVQSLKSRAMCAAVQPLNHLASVAGRKKTTISPHKSDLKTPSGKIKTGNHTKLVTTSPKKRKTHETSPKKKSKVTLPSKEHANDHSDGDALHAQTPWYDVVLEDPLRPADETVTGDKQPAQEGEAQTDAQRAEELPIEIEIESLPLLMRTEARGQEIEIEVIDNVKPSKVRKTDKKVSIKSEPNAPPTGPSDSSDDETLAEIIVKSNENTAMKTYKKEKDQNDSLEKTFPINKRDVTSLKRRDIQSRFKKMGMLPVANFKDQQKE